MAQTRRGGIWQCRRTVDGEHAPRQVAEFGLASSGTPAPSGLSNARHPRSYMRSSQAALHTDTDVFLAADMGPARCSLGNCEHYGYVV